MKSKMRLVLTLTSFLLSGCAGMTGMVTDVALEAVGLGTTSDSGISVDTEIVAGDKEQSLNLDSIDSSTKFDDVELAGNASMNVSSETSKQKNVIKADNVQYEEGVPYWQVALMSIVWFCVGLFLPQLAIRKK